MSSPLFPGRPEPAPLNPGGSPTVRADVRGRWGRREVSRSPPSSPRINAVVKATLLGTPRPAETTPPPGTPRSESPLRGRVSSERPFSPNSSDYEVEFKPVSNQGPPPVVVRRLPSGTSSAVRMSLNPEIQRRFEVAFENLKNLVIPWASHCEFDMKNASVRYMENGVEGNRLLNLRKLIAKSVDPLAAHAAAREFHLALQLVSGRQIPPFNIDDNQVLDSQRIALRKEGDAPSSTVLSRLPPLPTTEEIMEDASAIKKSFTSNVELVLQLVDKALKPREEVLAGLNRIGLMESCLSLFTSELRTAYNRGRNELIELREEEMFLRNQFGAGQSAIREQIVKNVALQQPHIEKLTQIEELFKKTQVDRLALYMGLMFAPDTSEATTSRELIKTADNEALRVQQRLQGYFDEVIEEQIKPSLGLKVRIKAKLPFTDPLDEILGKFKDPSYIINVSSLVYAHLPSIEAERGAQDWMVRNEKKPLAPSREAGWIGLLAAEDEASLPTQVNSFIKEFAQVLFHKPDFQKRCVTSTTSMLNFKRQAPLVTFTSTPPSIIDQLWDHYIPSTTDV